MCCHAVMLMGPGGGHIHRMQKDKHKAIHHLSQRSEHHGWVESIESLTEDTPATDLLINGSKHAACDARPEAIARLGARLPPEEEYQAILDHALEFMRAEVRGTSVV